MAAGSIRKRTFKRTDGTMQTRYQVVVDLGPDPLSGKRRQRARDYKTRSEARKILAEWLNEIDRGEAVDRTKDTVAACCHRWLDTYAQFKSPKTYEDYARTINKHVVPHLGKKQVQQLMTVHARTWIAELLKAGVGHRTVELAHMRLCQVLDQALADGLVPRNAARTVKVPQPNERGNDLQVWTADEAQRFLEAAEKDAPYGPIWLLSLATGMREGELLGLRWCDIAWETRTVRVRQASGTVNSRQVIKPLKTRSARRDVVVTPHVLTALKEWRLMQNERRLALGAAWADNDLIFASEIGTLVPARNLRRVYDRIVARCGVTRIRVHDQRHTHVTWALEDGIDLKTISERVGHAKPTITASLYGQVTRRMQEDVAQKNDARLFGTTG